MPASLELSSDRSSAPPRPHLRSVSDPAPRRTRVLIVDDSDLVQCGLRLLLSRQPWIERCLPARGVGDATAIARRYEPHLALVDYRLSHRNPEMCAALRRALPALKIILVGEPAALPKRLLADAGVFGYLSKRARGSVLVESVRNASEGRPVGGASVSADSDLSVRQLEVLELIACGATNREIADALIVSPDTVKAHTRAIYQRLGVRNRAQAVLRGREHGLVG
jgi:DNA-binding NarL/FixJ family response regulator